MPFQMKVQPIDERAAARIDPAKPTPKSRLKRLFERQFPGVMRISVADKPGDGRERTDDGGEVEPSSVCLDKMVVSFMEDGGNERPPRGRCYCFNGNYEDSSDDETDIRGGGDYPADAAELIKGLILCASVAERNLLADASKIMEKAKNSKGKEECRRIVVEGLQSLGYNAAICKSKWDKNPSFPAGEYDYIDVVIDGSERILVDVDFRPEFEIARSTKSYRAVLHHLPLLFVGRPDRLQHIVAVVSEAARQSLKKKDLHVPPWRKPDYMRAKWISSYTRMANSSPKDDHEPAVVGAPDSVSIPQQSTGTNPAVDASSKICDGSEPMAAPWEPPPARPRSGVKIIAGLTAVL
ncbi:uncharacterized protein LOC121979416 isoform X1 [Zingiber officinale]|uniref:Uncharacterized protein n=2 Tax=Zingiber officinale TaxID=94328 RepID=A0A8J5HQW2_ZINOF|nr:uncharacterized protein LOC121979416 isoform X1 [Zingiber officinale]KAG6533542.1 hypothetical protein ZIOFF_007417 [Zingiber officinale]